MRLLGEAARHVRALSVLALATALAGGCDAVNNPAAVSDRRLVPQAINIDGSRHWTDWTEYTPLVQPVGWTQVWDPTSHFKVADEGAGNRVLSWNADGTSRNRWGLAYDGFGTLVDQEVYTEFRVRSLGTGTNIYYMGSAAVRMTGTSANEGGYAVWFVASAGSRSLALSTWTNGAYAQLATNSLAWADDVWYSVRLQAVGSNIRARVWPRGTTEPVAWTMSVTDTRWGAGRPGVSHHDNGNVQWDYWEATQLGPATIQLTELNLTPTSPTVAPGDTIQFAVSGVMNDASTTTPAVSYTATGGTIDASGRYIAGATPGTFQVIATHTGTPALADTAAVTIALQPAGALSVTYDFTEHAAGTLPSVWTETAYPANSDWSIAADASVSDGRVLRNVTTTTNRHILKLNTVPDTTADQEILVKLRALDEDGRGAGVAIRHRMNGTSESAYVAYLRTTTDQLELNEFVNGGWGFLGARNVTINPGVWYWIRFRAVGPSLKARIWMAGTAEPATWSIELTDTSLPTGSAGLYTYEPNTIDYDGIGFASQGATASTPTGAPPTPPTLSQVVLTPATVSIGTGAAAQFNASALMSDGSTATVSVNYTATGGTISSSGLYTAGGTAGTYHVIAIDAETATKADTSVVTVTAPVVLTAINLTPASVTLSTDATQQFSATGVMSDGSSSTPAVTYTAAGGTITASGLYTAGAVAGTYNVIATNAASSLADTSVVTITSAPPPPPPPPSSTQITFTEYPLGAPAGWTETAYPANSDWQIVADATAADGRVLRNVTTTTNRHILRYNAIADSTTEQEVLVKLRVADDDGRGPGIALRHTMNGTAESAYVAYLRTTGNQLEINRFVNGGWGFVGAQNVTLDPGVWYWIRFRASGTALKAKVWVDGTAEPAWGVQVSDANLTAGSAGVYAYEPNTVDYDAFSFAGQGGTAATPSAGPPPPPPTLTQVVLTPATAAVNTNATLQLQATGQFSDGTSAATSVTYSTNGGTVSASGLYTAPATAGTYNVIATSTVNAALADTSVITVTAPPTLTGISLTPATTTMNAGAGLQFQTTGSLSNGGTTSVTVTYTATGGSISASGFYTAGSTPGSYTVIATTTTSPVFADTSTITVTVPPPSSGTTWFTNFSLATVGTTAPDLMKVRSNHRWDFNLIVRADPSAPGGKVLKLEGPNPTVNGSSRPHAWLQVPAANEQEIVVRLRTADTVYAAGGAYLSGSVNSLNLPSEYGARFARSRFSMWNYKNGSFNSVEVLAPEWVPGQWMWIRLRMTSTQVMARYWVDGQPEPASWRFTQARNFGANGGSGTLIPTGHAGIYTNSVASGVEYSVIGAAVDGATAPTSGTTVMGTLPPVVTPGAFMSTDFAADPVGQTPAGWAPANVTSNITWNVFDFGTFKGVRAVATTTGANRLLKFTGLGDTTTDQEIVTRVRVNAIGRYGVGVALRVESDAGGADSFYAVALGQLGVDVIKVVNGTRTVLGEPGVQFDYVAGEWLWLRARVQGTSIMAKVWRPGEPEPGSWGRVVNDASLTAGSVGLYYLYPNTADFANIAIKSN